MPTPSDVATATGGAQAAGGLSATCFRLASPASAAGAAVLVAILAGTVAALSPLYHDPDSAPGAAVPGIQTALVGASVVAVVARRSEEHRGW
jgi:hypothetical protein